MREGGDEDGDTDGRVLSADELDITEQEEVAPLGEGRFVVGSDGPPAAPDEATGDASTSARRPEPADNPAPDEDEGVDDGTDPDPNATQTDDGGTTADADPASDDSATDDEGDITGRDVKSWLSEELTRHDTTYAHHVAAKAGDDVANQQLATDDIGAAFDGLLVWYARQVATDTPVDEALGILLSESGVRVRYPTARLVEYVEAKGLGPDDSIGDLVAAVSEDDGLVFTKRQ
ncbi:DUF7500 family protein [Halobacterium zhouii]|uniref:DUF7500 family protein n=1 Tax=Halobacterium zhouii TaxID=2902624 RepID=UPI001E56B9D4|nr:hypothetical protein [Halobacterium zhouii]